MSAAKHSRAISVNWTNRVLGLGWYPSLVVAAWFVEVWLSTRVDAAAVWRSLLIALAIAAVTTVVLSQLLGKHRGAIAAVIVLAGLIGIRDIPTASPFVAAIVLLLIERSWHHAGRVRLPWPTIHESLSIITVALLLLQVGRVVTAQLVVAPNVEWATWESTILDSDRKPSIYIILADAHSRDDVLRDLYDYDNEGFIKNLQSLGFEVALESRANYLTTRFSLASMFTGSYLAQLHDGSMAESADEIAASLIRGNPAFPLLRNAGYKVSVVSSGYEHLGLRSADEFIETAQPNEFEGVLLASTAIGTGILTLLPDFPLRVTRARTEAQLALLPSLVTSVGPHPNFVFMHLPVPHWPYAFDSTCRPATTALAGSPGDLGASARERVRLVREQTMCVDHLLSDLLSDVVERDPGAVIILMSDHGQQEFFDPAAPTDVGLNERSAILFAARTPGYAHLFGASITLVNVLPRLFNAYLGTSLPIQADRIWHGPSERDGSFVELDPATLGPLSSR